MQAKCLGSSLLKHMFNSQNNKAMKPFFTDTMLVTLTFQEACNLRAAIADQRSNWEDTDDAGNLIFPDVYSKYDALYNDLTKIIEMMPF